MFRTSVFIYLCIALSLRVRPYALPLALAIQRINEPIFIKELPISLVGLGVLLFLLGVLSAAKVLWK